MNTDHDLSCVPVEMISSRLWDLITLTPPPFHHSILVSPPSPFDYPSSQTNISTKQFPFHILSRQPPVITANMTTDNTLNETQIKLLLTILEHSPTKMKDADFDEVAVQTGYKDKAAV